MKSLNFFYQKSLYASSNFIPSNFLLGISDKIIIPAYSVISEEPLPYVKYVQRIKSVTQFKKDLDFLLKNFKPIDLKTLIQKTDSKVDINKDLFHLTFDGNFKDHYETVAPILQQKGIPATFFINPSFLDNKDLMYRYKISLIINNIKKNKVKKDQVVKFIKRKMGIRREAIAFLPTLKYSHRRILDEIATLTNTNFNDYLINNKPLLTTEHIHSLIKDGFTIGANSMDHPEYYMISEEEQIRQTLDSINFISTTFHTDYKVFAFPFSDREVSRQLFELIHNSQKQICDLSFGKAGITNSKFEHHLQRIAMNKKFSGKEIIKGEYLNYYLKKIISK